MVKLLISLGIIVVLILAINAYVHSCGAFHFCTYYWEAFNYP